MNYRVMRLMKKRLITILLAISAICNYAMARQFEDLTHNRAYISGMLTSSDSWQVDLGYHYMIFPYLGVGGGIGSWGNYYVDGYASGNNWNIASDDEKPWSIYIRPSIVLKTPALKIRSVYVGIYAEPGVMMNIPYQSVYIDINTNGLRTDSEKISTNKGQWHAFDARIGLYINVGPCGISVGYMMSNLDIYSQRRNLSYNGVSFSKFYPKKSFMQGAFLTASYYF